MGDVFEETAETNDIETQARSYLTRDNRNNPEWSRILNSLIERGEPRLILNFNEMRHVNPDLVKAIIEKPAIAVPAITKALNDEIRNSGYEKKTKVDFQVGFDGSLATHHVSPRGLHQHLLGKLVMVEGIVTKCTIVRPKLVKSIHYCEATKAFSTNTFRDATSLTGLPTGSTYRREDDNGNQLTTEFGMCEYTDRQTFTIQESPELTPPGQLPRSIDVVVEGDLVDKCKPGDRAKIVGIYKTLAGRQSGITNGYFKTVLLPNSISLTGNQSRQIMLTEGDLANIQNLAKDKGYHILDFLANSVAPSIHGHDAIKRAVVLLLLGGKEKYLPNGGHLRGDINMLMVGDPSTAKSQILRFVLNIAPMAISTSGRGSTGVGLTAAVTMDNDTGERRLEAGAMVLGDRGVVCIDEFDKMNEADRTAIHEVMEQQTVTVAKAGIHATLNARCSVVAAANPIFGQYDPNTSASRNIGMPDSLLSRFDLLFIVHDRRDPIIDRAISNHVLNSHMFRAAGEEDGAPVRVANSSIIEDSELRGIRGASANEVPETPMYAGFNRQLHGEDREVLNIQFLRKYIFHVKNTIRPTFGEAASRVIAEAYVKLRQHEARGNKRILPITARTLETMIRLSTAHAKARLSERVTEADANVAVRLLEWAIKNADPAKAQDNLEEAIRREKGYLGEPITQDEGDDDAYTSQHGDDDQGEERPVTRSQALPADDQTRKRAAPQPEIEPADKRVREDTDLDVDMDALLEQERMMAEEVQAVQQEIQQLAHTDPELVLVRRMIMQLRDETSTTSEKLTYISFSLLQKRLPEITRDRLVALVKNLDSEHLLTYSESSDMIYLNV